MVTNKTKDHIESSQINIETNFLTNRRSQKIFTVKVNRDSQYEKATAVVFFIHGLNDHCLRAGYIKLYQSLSQNGCDIFSLDHHGHGQSEGQPRAYCHSFNDFVEDYLDFIKLKTTDYQSTPIYIIGQSMGGLCAILASVKLGSKNIAGLLLTAPACGVELDLLKKIQKLFSPIINILIPTAKIVDAVKPEDLCRDMDEVEDYITDELVIKGKTCARTAIEISNAFEKLSALSSKIVCPIIIFHGTDDKVTNINASLNFFSEVGTQDAQKLFVKLHGFYHEILNEPESQKILDMINSFILSKGKELPIKENINHSIVDLNLVQA